MPTSTAEKLYTADEYLKLEEAAQTKSEFFNGRIYAMAGVSVQHDRIVVNTFTILQQQLRGRDCETFSSDLRVQVLASGLYTYPDVSVVCGEPQFDERLTSNLLNPIVLIEVLSPSTEAYDRGDKFAHYRMISSLREYVLIAQDRIRVEQFAREGEKWVLTAHNDIDSVVDLASIGCTVPLRDLYARVRFPPRIEFVHHLPG